MKKVHVEIFFRLLKYAEIEFFAFWAFLLFIVFPFLHMLLWILQLSHLYSVLTVQGNPIDNADY